jgi:hypothetical protein
MERLSLEDSRSLSMQAMTEIGLPVPPTNAEPARHMNCS